MKFKNKNRLCFFLLIFVLNSCIIDSKPLGYSVKNCSKDTLFIDLTISDTLPDDIYWGTYPEDTICVDENDTTILYIHGDKDDFVPYYMMDELYNATNSEKEKLTIEGGEHANSDLVNPKLYWSTVNSFLEKYIEN